MLVGSTGIKSLDKVRFAEMCESDGKKRAPVCVRIQACIVNYVHDVYIASNSTHQVERWSSSDDL